MVFHQMNHLIDDFEFDHTLTNFHKQDKIKHIPPSYNNPFQSFNDLIDENISHQAQVIIRKYKTKQELIQYLHGCCFWPVKATWKKAINNGHLNTWPGLTSELLQHLPSSIITAKGHQKQKSSSLQPTN